MDTGIKVEFGDGTDDDTFYSAFGGLIGMVIGVAKAPFAVTDMKLVDTWHPDGTPGFYGEAWDDDLGKSDPGEHLFVPWDFVDRVVIY